jgi:hypothetical protein
LGRFAAARPTRFWLVNPGTIAAHRIWSNRLRHWLVCHGNRSPWLLVQRNSGLFVLGPEIQVRISGLQSSSLDSERHRIAAGAVGTAARTNVSSSGGRRALDG